MEKTEDRQSLQNVREDLEELDKWENNNCKKFKNLVIIRLDSLSFGGGGVRCAGKDISLVLLLY